MFDSQGESFDDGKKRLGTRVYRRLMKLIVVSVMAVTS